MFGCMFCNREFTEAIKAQSHQDTEHDYVLLPILRSELSLLIHYLQISTSAEPSLTKADLVDPALYKRMKKLSENIAKNS